MTTDELRAKLLALLYEYNEGRPRDTTIGDLANALGCSPDRLLEDSLRLFAFDDKIIEMEACEDFCFRPISTESLGRIYRGSFRIVPLPKARREYEDVVRRKKERRFVQSGEDLLLVLGESLGRLEAELRGKPNLVFSLWNEGHSPKRAGRRRTSGRRLSAKEEGRLSDYVMRYLERDLRGRGIIANREVEIQPLGGTTRGEKVDLKIDAFVLAQDGRPSDVISAIVETKGCWNRYLLAAMQTQLRDTYLKSHSCRNGLYLVGWYCGQGSSCGKRRKTSCKLKSLEEARKFFAKQANDLTGAGCVLSSFVLDVSL